mgnify:CR=1 FL=1
MSDEVRIIKKYPNRRLYDTATSCYITLEDVKKLVEERKAGLKDGSFVIWRGPIVDQSGKVMLAKDQVAEDKWMHEIKWYVKGVQGAVPK